MSSVHAFAHQAPAVAAPPRGTVPVTLVAQEGAAATPEPLGALPGEWELLEGVVAGAEPIDLVIVGPNGLFAVHLDPDARPAAVRPGFGLVRTGARQPDPVKAALRGADALRRRLAHLPGDHFPYPVLVTATPSGAGQRLGRLLVVRPGRLAEAIWSHVSRPLRRSERTAIAIELRRP